LGRGTINKALKKRTRDCWGIKKAVHFFSKKDKKSIDLLWVVEKSLFTALINEIFDFYDQTYGSPGTMEQLKRKGYHIYRRGA